MKLQNDEMMPLEQFQFIEGLRDYMYEYTNMSKNEADDFAFRVWQVQEYLKDYIDEYGEAKE